MAIDTTAAPSDRTSGHTRRMILASLPAVIGLVALVAAWFLLPVPEWLQQFSAWVRGYGAFGVAMVSVVYVLATVALVPGVPLTLAVAAAYGWWALPICFFGGLVAAAISFMASRTVFRDKVKRFIQRRPTLKALDAVTGEDGFKTILLARLTPVTPFAMENYAFGVTGVRLWPFLLATAIGIVPGTIQNVWVGVIGRTAAEGEAGLLNWALLILGLGAAVVLTVWLTRRTRQKLAAEPAG